METKSGQREGKIELKNLATVRSLKAFRKFLRRWEQKPYYCGLEKRMKPETVKAKREERIKHERVKVKRQKMLSRNLVEKERGMNAV